MTVPVRLGQASYDIEISRGAIDLAAEKIVKKDRRILVVTDSGVPTEYSEQLLSSLGDGAILHVFPQGEESKNFETLQGVLRKMLEAGFVRSDCVVALGGGVVGDLAGFAAATYMRGIDFYNIPTTLLSQVDSSVGGKTAVDLDGYKNMIGCFNQPEFVLCDIGMLRTLSDRQFRAGLAELIKTGLLGNRVLFEMVEALTFEEVRRDPLLTADLVLMAIKIKAGIVERDERESGERRKLNLGHTVAHAIEKCSRKMLHGEAVAVGCVVMARLAADMGLLPARDAERIERMFERMGFTLTSPAPIEKLITALRKDKKSAGDQIKIVLPTAIGQCEVRSVMFDWLDERLRQVIK